MASNRGKVHSTSLFVEKLLAKIDSLWGKIAFIGVIFCVGAKAGGYYTETKMTKEQNKNERSLMDEWSSKEQSFQAKIDGLKIEIDALKNERLELKSEIYELKTQYDNGTKK